MKVFLMVMGLFPILSVAQWNYSSGGNVFDGKYKTASVKGLSDEYSPLFVVNLFNNESINIYITNIGYLCDKVSVVIAFDDKKVHSLGALISQDKESLFLQFDDDYGSRFAELGKKEFIDLLKLKSKLYVRIDNKHCGKDDLIFSLSGSSKAIDYVLSNYTFPSNQEKENKKWYEDESIKEIDLISSESIYIDTYRIKAGDTLTLTGKKLLSYDRIWYYQIKCNGKFDQYSRKFIESSITEESKLKLDSLLK